VIDCLFLYQRAYATRGISPALSAVAVAVWRLTDNTYSTVTSFVEQQSIVVGRSTNGLKS
jgi:hypothetical protein